MSSRPSLHQPLQTVLPTSLYSLILLPSMTLPPSTSTTNIPTPPTTMMTETSQPCLQCPLSHPQIPVPLPPGSSPSLAPLPSTSMYARSTPKMSMAYGVEHETPKDASPTTASGTLSNWNTSFIGCVSTTLMHGLSRKHG
jgi:hypothetical protein